METKTTPKIRIILVSNYFYPELSGGVMLFHRIWPFMRKRGVEFHAVTVKRENHSEFECEFEGIQIHRFSHPNANDYEEKELLIKDAIELCKTIKPAPTIIKMMSSGGIRCAIDLLKVRIQGVPAIYWVTFMPEAAPKNIVAGCRYRLWGKLAMSGFSKIFALTEEMKRVLNTQFWIPKHRLAVVGNGADLDRYKPPTSELKTQLRMKYGLPVDAEIVFYGAAFVPRKQVDVVLRSWEKVVKQRPKAVFFMVGEFPKPPHWPPHWKSEKQQKEFQEYQDLINKIIEALPNPGSVVKHSQVNSLEEVLQLSDLFVLPSKAEGFPTALIESMATEVPAIVGNFQGLPSVENDVDGILKCVRVCSNEPEHWTESIVELLSNRESADLLRRNAKNWVKEHQDMNLIADRIYGEYCRVLGLKP